MKFTQIKIDTAMRDRAAPVMDHGHDSIALQIAVNVATVPATAFVIDSSVDYTCSRPPHSKVPLSRLPWAALACDPRHGAVQRDVPRDAGDALPLGGAGAAGQQQAGRTPGRTAATTAHTVQRRAVP